MAFSTSTWARSLIAIGAVLGNAACISARINLGPTTDLEKHVGAEFTLAVTGLVDAEPEDQGFFGPTLVAGAGASHDGQGVEAVVGTGLDMILAPEDSPVGLRGGLRADMYLAKSKLRAAGMGVEVALPIQFLGPKLGSSSDEPHMFLGPYVNAQAMLPGSKDPNAHVALARLSFGLSYEVLAAKFK